MFTAIAFITALGSFGGVRHMLGLRISSTAQLHVTLGWSLVVAYFIMLIFGGFRPYAKRFRIIIIASHSIIGFVLYLLICADPYLLIYSRNTVQMNAYNCDCIIFF